MFIRDARAIAEGLVSQVSPFCRRVQIAGSVRRGRQEVKDIEIVAIPEWGTRRGDALPLFGGEPEPVNLLHEWAVAGVHSLQWIKTGTSEIVPWLPKPGGKYWRAVVDGQIKLDLFLTTEEQWGLIYLIRTGSAEFSQGVMTYVKHQTGYRITDGALLDEEGKVLPTPEEEEVFKLLRLDYVEPCGRVGFAAVRKGGRDVFPPGYVVNAMAARGLREVKE
jgi:DNA polymerase/3'-5' exonuclease PolX